VRSSENRRSERIHQFFERRLRKTRSGHFFDFSPHLDHCQDTACYHEQGSEYRSTAVPDSQDVRHRLLNSVDIPQLLHTAYSTRSRWFSSHNVSRTFLVVSDGTRGAQKTRRSVSVEKKLSRDEALLCSETDCGCLFDYL